MKLVLKDERMPAEVHIEVEEGTPSFDQAVANAFDDGMAALVVIRKRADEQLAEEQRKERLASQ